MRNISTREDLLQSLYKCNQCGACSSVCPLYRHTADESMCARGKLALIDAALEGRIKPGKRLRDRIYSCLTCQACAANCASGVPTTEILLFARQMLADSGRLPRTYQMMLRHLLTGPRRFRAGVKVLNALQHAGLRHLTGIMPKSWRVAGMRLSPALSRSGLQAAVPGPAARGEVAYFTGCAVAGVFPGVARATARVLVHNGWQAVIRNNGCCGMPHQVYGDIETARRLARKNIDLLGGFESIVTDCATCGAALKDYGSLLADDGIYCMKAAEFSSRVRDISEFLIEKGLRPPADTEVKNKIAVTYHDPCHLARGQGIRRQPRLILKAVPGIRLVEMGGPEACCGGSGLFPLAYPQLSGMVGKDKAEAVISAGADVVASGCPGCMMQLGLSLREAGHPGVRVTHPVELLVEAYEKEETVTGEIKPSTEQE